MARKKKDEAETCETTAVEPEIEKKEQEAAEDEAAVIYAGASLPGVRGGTVFRGKLPEILEREYIRELCIPIESFPEFLKRKNVTSSREAICYRKSMQLAAELASKEG